MNSIYQKGQRVITPHGEGFVEEIIGDEIIVKLENGEVKSFSAEQLEDDADQG